MPKCSESILLFGASGVGKTSQSLELALYTAMKKSKKTRLVCCSGGGWTVVQPGVEEGLIEPTYIRDRANPVETLDRMTKGWWPADPQDPASPLIPPEKQKDWANVGAIFYDGISEACEWTMQTMVSKEARGEVRISTEGLAARFKDGDTFYATPGRAHYGTIQNNIGNFVAQSKSIPDRYIVWTALELKATDDVTRVPIYGPDVIGKAKSSVAPAWFDDTLHLTMVPVLQGKIMKNERRMYLTQHTIGDDPVPYLSKTRIPVGVVVPDYLTGDAFTLYAFLSLLDSSVDKGVTLLKERLERIGAEASINLMNNFNNKTK